MTVRRVLEVVTPEEAFSLRSLAACGGCAAKVAPEMTAALAGTAANPHPAVLVGLQPGDDAAVTKLDEDRALVSTVDFFPPLVDGPHDYGTIAAANAVSDIYAMGGEVAYGLVISGFPRGVPDEVVATVNRAAGAVISQCGGSVIGGHSIHCTEPVFGLAVTGFVHPDRVWRKSGAQPGDAIVLSKPIGTGVLLSRGGPGVTAAIECMTRTNMEAACSLKQCGPHAVTDVTGYGLVGHGLEMAQRSGVTLVIETQRVPLLDGALAACRAGIRTSADKTNRRAARDSVVADIAIPGLETLLYDPQTSGGLLAAVEREAVSELETNGFRLVGYVEPGPASIRLT